MLSWGKTS